MVKNQKIRRASHQTTIQRDHSWGMSVLAAMLVLTSLSIGTIARLSARPANGVVSPLNAQLVAAAPKPVLKQYNNAFVTFQYPAAWMPGIVQLPQSPILSNTMLVGHDAALVRMAVTILRVPSGRLEDNGAYQLRLSQPQTYTADQIIVQGVTVPAMRDHTAPGYSTVVFLMHGEKQAVISLSGIDLIGHEPLERTLREVLQNWQWLG